MDGLIGFISTMPFWYWFIFAIALLTIEIMTGSTYFLWPAIAAVVVGIADLWPLGEAWQLQLILFAVITVVLSVIAPPYVKPWISKTQKDHFTLNQRGEQKIGQRATVGHAFSNGAGKVQFGDTQWLAKSEDGVDFAEGASVVIAKVEGVTLIVKSV